MKISGKCPKCGSTDTWHNEGKMPYSDRSFIVTSLFGRQRVDAYICASCGFIEEYVNTTKPEKLDPIRKKWKRTGG